MTDYGGIFRGFVEDVVDPAKRGRVRVRIPSIHGNVSTALLPWAERSMPDGGGPYGMYSPLKAATNPGNHAGNDGDVVFVMFEGCDKSLPVVTGTWRRSDEMPATAVEDEGMARRHVFTSRHGIRLEFGDKQSDFEFKIVMPGGNVFQLRESPGGRGIHLTTADGCVLSLQDETSGVSVPAPKNDYDNTPERQHVFSETASNATRVIPIPEEKPATGQATSGTPGLPQVFGQRGIMLRTPNGHVVKMMDTGAEAGLLIQTVGGHFLSMNDVTNVVTLSSKGGNVLTMTDGVGTTLVSQWGQSIIMTETDFGMEWPAVDMFLRFGGGVNRWKIVGNLTIDCTGTFEILSGGDMNLEAQGTQYCIGHSGRVESPEIPTP